MDALKPPSARSNVLLTVVALTLWAIGCITLLRDIVKTHQQSTVESEAAVIAQRALSQVQDPATGWFPFSRDPVFSFETDEQGWKLEDGGLVAASVKAITRSDDSPARLISNPALPPGEQSQALKISDKAASNGRSALAVPVSFPAPVTIIRDNSLNDGYRLQGVRFVSYDVFVPPECHGYVGCLLFLKDKDGLWYQARSRAALLPGRWTTVTADIRGDSADVTPLGHLGQWDDNQATRVRAIGITFYGDRDFRGEILLDNLRAFMRPQRYLNMVNQLGSSPGAPIAADRIAKLQELSALAENYKPEPIKLMNLRTDPPAPLTDGKPSVAQFETLTLRFELNREVDNPFDPEKVSITCVVTTPAGELLEHVGFWYQDYDRGDRFDSEDLTPMGRPEWRVRITPRLPGEYKYQLKVNIKGETVELPVRTFKCDASGNKGFLRVCPTDKRWFEYESGEFFYPIGHNLHTPVDLRSWGEIFKKEAPAGRGLPMYMDFFAKMQQNGQNTAEVWMASWWVGIEWTSKWRDYYGAGRYSLQNAWKLDFLLDLARKHDINIHLVLDNHGKFSAWCDWEWPLNPYNSTCDPGGVVVSANDFFTNETARKWHRNRLRYIAARWGSNPTILGWELVSEFDLIGGRHQRDSAMRQNRLYERPPYQNWAKEMLTYLRECDIYNHPVTNHYATDYTLVDRELAASEHFDYVVTDAYRPPVDYSQAAAAIQNWADNVLTASGNRKPFWITEYGGNFDAAHPNALHADIHCGLWATWMTEGCGSPLFWWYDFIDVNNYYSYYKAFANYIKGEDRRGKNGVRGNFSFTGGNVSGLLGSNYIWKTGGYGWVYNQAAMTMMPLPQNRPSHSDVQANVMGLEPGKYKVEYWDCYQGVVVVTENKDVGGNGVLALKFPTFHSNMAVKFKKE